MGGAGWNGNAVNNPCVPGFSGSCPAPDSTPGVDFGGAPSIGEIDVYSAHDNYAAPSEPTSTMISNIYGLTDFQMRSSIDLAWSE